MGNTSRRLRKLKLYQTKARFYLIGRTEDKQHYRVAKFSRVEDKQLQASDDPVLYTEKQCRRLLSSIHDGNHAHGGLNLVLEADALIGCFRLLEGYYLLFVTKKKLVGSICGTDKIYSIADIKLVSLENPDESTLVHESGDERRYRKVLSGVELTKNFFFSYTWPVWRTMQAHLSQAAPDNAWDSMFVWNNYLTRPLRSMIDANLWVMPLVHGHWQQRTLAVSAQTLTITIIARRSRYFAGTRYRKRGINDQGHVANDVETEQVVSAGFDWRTGFPIVSSVVQVRGSIPLFWIQDYNQRKLKPDILLQRFDPLYDATRLHFQNLSARYGHPIVVLNLVKSIEKRPREQLLRTEFGNAISYINEQRLEGEKLVYIPWDFNYWAKQRGSQILTHIAPVIKQCLVHTRFFASAPAAPASTASKTDASAWEARVDFQQGVLRTNCIDCLDRTNVAQFALGLHALGLQLQALGVSDSPVLDTRSDLAVELMNLYEQMGNVLARQYGGSEAHSTIFKRQRGDWEYATTIGDKLTSLRRYYSNNYTDAEKQDALNLFLGNYIPYTCKGQPAIWELDSDYYLHSGLGQRFLKSFLAKAPSGQATPSKGSGSGIASPRIVSGHSEGEGVRNYATLVAEASAQADRRSSDGSAHGSSRRSTAASMPQEPSVGGKSVVPEEANVHQARMNDAGAAAELASNVFVRDVGSQATQHTAAADLECSGGMLEGTKSNESTAGRTVEADLTQSACGDPGISGAQPLQQPANLSEAERFIKAPEDSRDALASGSANQLEQLQLGQLRSSEQQVGPDLPAAAQSGPQGQQDTSQILRAVQEAASAAEQRQSGLNGMPSSLQQVETGSDVGQVLQGLQRFRTSAAQKRRAKLESFDRKLGRQPNAILEVRLHAPSPGTSSFLPQWLASPLGIRSPMPPTAAGEAVPRAWDDPSLGPEEQGARLPKLLKSTNSPSDALQEPAKQRVNVCRPSLERRSADAGLCKLQPTGRPLLRSTSEMGGKWNQRSVTETMQEALSESIHPHSAAASQADLNPPFARADSRLDLVDGLFTVQSSMRAGSASLGAATSKEVAKGILSHPLVRSRYSSREDLSFLADEADCTSLGMTPGLHAWWTGTAAKEQAWAYEEQASRLAYARYVDDASHLGDVASRSAEASAEYQRLCDGMIPLDALLREPLQKAAYWHRAESMSWGERAIENLALERALVLREPLVA